MLRQSTPASGKSALLPLIVSVLFTAATVVLLLASRVFAQPQTGGMGGGMPMMGWPMMLFMGLFWVLLLILMVLAILWLIKQLQK
jgi:hypothetical protein